MFRISNEQELLSCFRPIDREEVLLPQDVRFPMIIQDYFAWSEPSGYRVYLVFAAKLSEPALGIVFRRDQAGPRPAAMCEWCRAVEGAGSVTLLSATASSNRRVGIQLCRDLGCKDKADLSWEQRKNIVAKMSVFARRTLF